MRVVCIGSAPSEGQVIALEAFGAEVAPSDWPSPGAAWEGTLDDILLVDLRAEPGRAGDIARWRSDGLASPVVVLVEPGETHVDALSAGADDYLIAPFAPEEIAARVVARGKRAGGRHGTLPLADGHIDLDGRVVVRGDQTATLTPMEVKLLAFLGRHAGASFNKAQLQAQVWGYRKGVRSRTVTSTVQRVRTKIERDPASPDHLVTTGDGYTLRPAQAEQTATATPSRQRRVRVPSAATPFVGRDDEVVAVREALADPATPLLTLLGPGGMGKTRLALEVATTSAADWADGVVFVELAPLKTAADILPAVAGALGLPPASDCIASLGEVLADFRGLLILDNLEHLDGASAQVASLLSMGEAVTVLATSRTPLKLSAEHLRELQGLAYPAGGDAAAFVASDAGRLFTDGARRVRADFEPRGADAEAVARVIQRVDGMPLALVLAASWVRSLSPAEIADELERNLDLLEGQLSDLPPRHRSVSAAIESSFHQLSDAQQQTLLSLSVFQRRASMADARLVADATLMDIVRLADSSLLKRDQDGYLSMHPLIRSFSSEQLKLRAALQHEVVARYRHLFADRASGISRQADNMEGFESLIDTVSADLDEFIAAFWRCVDALELERALRFTSLFYLIWESDFGASTAFFTKVVDHLRDLPASTPGRAALLAAALARLGFTGSGVGAVQDPARLLDEAERLLASTDDTGADYARALVWLSAAMMCFTTGRHDRGLEHARAAQGASKVAGTRWFGQIALGSELLNLGGLGDHQAFLARLPLVNAPRGDARADGRGQMTAGLTALILGDLELALELFDAAADNLLHDPDRGFVHAAMLGSGGLRLKFGRAGGVERLREAFEEFLAHRIGIHFLAMAAPALLEALAGYAKQSGQDPAPVARGLRWAERLPNYGPADFDPVRAALGEQAAAIAVDDDRLAPTELVADWLELLADG